MTSDEGNIALWERLPIGGKAQARPSEAQPPGQSPAACSARPGAEYKPGSLGDVGVARTVGEAGKQGSRVNAVLL